MEFFFFVMAEIFVLNRKTAKKCMIIELISVVAIS